MNKVILRQINKGVNSVSPCTRILYKIGYAGVMGGYTCTHFNLEKRSQTLTLDEPLGLLPLPSPIERKHFLWEIMEGSFKMYRK